MYVSIPHLSLVNTDAQMGLQSRGWVLLHGGRGAAQLSEGTTTVGVPTMVVQWSLLLNNTQ